MKVNNRLDTGESHIQNTFGHNFNPNRHGRFLKFSKNLKKKFKKIISPQLRVPKKRTIARLKGLVLGFHFAQVSSCRRARLQNFSFFFRYRRFAAVPLFVRPAARGLVVTTEYYRGLLHQDLLWKGMCLVFSIDQRLLRKQDFVKI